MFQQAFSFPEALDLLTMLLFSLGRSGAPDGISSEYCASQLRPRC